MDVKQWGLWCDSMHEHSCKTTQKCMAQSSYTQLSSTSCCIAAHLFYLHLPSLIHLSTTREQNPGSQICLLPIFILDNKAELILERLHLRFHSDSNATTSDKTLMRSVFRWPIESCVTSVYRSWSWTFFNSCSDIALEVAFWYRSIGKTLLTSKKRKCACDKAIKKRYRSSMNSA